MTLIGLSIIVVTFTYFLYKVPPSSWLPSWLFPTPQKPDSHCDVSRSEQNKIEPSQSPDGNETKKNIIPPNAAVKEAKAELDRKAMPPPVVLIKPPQKPNHEALSQPALSQIRPVMSSKPLARDYELPVPTLPSFPAMNSAQRASGSQGVARLNPPPSMQPPLRSIYSASPPSRSPAPNRGSTSSLAPPPTHNSIPPKPKQKVGLTPGHSPLDWARLSDSPNSNLRGLPTSTPYLKVTPSQLRQYTGRKGKDAWTVLGGKVYNITPYLPYHPGGAPELMKCAGRDGTKLFADIHPWVNFEGMLGACLIGIAVGETEMREVSSLEHMD